MTVGGAPVTVAPRDDVAANQGGLRHKGWTAADLLEGPDRLTTPLRRAHLRAPVGTLHLGAPLPSDRLTLLLQGAGGPAVTDSPVRMPDAATVCHCNNVTKRKIRACWQQGARAADAVAARTRAGTGCGGCRDAVEGIVSWLGEQHFVDV